jgi:hypothetical protein
MRTGRMADTKGNMLVHGGAALADGAKELCRDAEGVSREGIYLLDISREKAFGTPRQTKGQTFSAGSRALPSSRTRPGHPRFDYDAD